MENMLTNPLDIKKGTFFLCGPTPPTTGLVNADFEKFEKVIRHYNQEVFNPETNVLCKDTLTRCDFLVMCEYVVTLPGYDTNDQAKQEVAVARSLRKEIIPAVNFDRWVKKLQKVEATNE